MQKLFLYDLGKTKTYITELEDEVLMYGLISFSGRTKKTTI